MLGISDEDLRMADDKEVYDATGTPSGYLGPIGLDIQIIADNEVAAMVNFAVGANEKNFHVLNCNMGRDFKPAKTGDIRKVTADDKCILCGSDLQLTKGIEVGHIFKLGTKYSAMMNATFLDDNSQEQPFIMGCYGIGVSRVVAAAIEQNNDKDGMIFPAPIAPVQVIILNLGLKDAGITEAANSIYAKLLENNIEALLDDRDERPGVKFKDADLIGIPYRVTAGKSFSTNNIIEIRNRENGEVKEVPFADCVPEIIKYVEQSLNV